MVVLVLLACVFFGVAVYNLSCAFANIPTVKTSKMMMLSRKQQGVKREKMLDIYITRIALIFEKYVKLDKLKKAKIQTALNIAEIEVSPEVYTLKAYITSLFVSLCSVPAFIIHPLLVLVVISMAVTFWFSTYYTAFDFVKKRKKIIEAEIPRFALTIAQNLENDRDVLKILSHYRRVAGNDFKQELDQTIGHENRQLRKGAITV